MGWELDRRARAYAYRAYTKLPEKQRGRFPGTAAAQRLLATGPVRIEGGVGKGLVFAPSSVPLGHVQAHGVVRGSLEIEVQEALRRSIGSGSVVYDIGANVGFFSLIAARLTGTAGQVHAFEPIPDNVRGIARNAAVNGMLIHCHEVAISDFTGSSRLSIPDQGTWGHLTEQSGPHPQECRDIAVDVTTLDEIVRAVAAPDVVKIDVEGYELEVLRGATGLLEDVRPVLVCELHGVRNQAVLDLLAAAGYSVTNLHGPRDIATAGPVHVMAEPR